MPRTKIQGLSLEKKAMCLVSDKKASELILYCVALEKYPHHDFLSLEFNKIQSRQENCDRIA
jgi:hypothetical protein